MIYLDYNAIACGFEDILKEVLDLSLECKFLNSSSIHQFGKQANKILEDAKSQIANSLNAKCHDIYFVSGATEGNNMVLNARNFDKIFTLKTEHDSILSPLQNKPSTFIQTDSDGIIDLNHLKSELETLKSSSFLCSVMLVNNESGVIQSIKEISKIVHEFGGIMHSDCSQALGKIKFDYSELGVDIATFSGSKMHAGLGGGFVVFNSGFDFNPFIKGGGQQNYKRGGTENILQIFAMSESLNRVNSLEYLNRYQAQTSIFQAKIEDMVLKNGGDIFAKSAQRVTNTSFIKMNNANNFIQLMRFDLENIAVSIGSACSSGKTDISHVLKACNVSQNDAKNYIRVSTGIFTTEEEIDTFCRVWQNLSRR
jgi:cysteine desulfurase